MTALPLLHRAWRALPADARRAAFLAATAALAPKPDRQPPDGAPPGLVVAGELGRASGLGEGARLMLAAARALGLPAAGIDAAIVPGGERDEVAGGADGTPPPPRGVPLVLHVNPPVLPAAALRLGRRTLRGRRVVGYWAWELPVAPPGWRAGLPFVHEIWAPSRFTAAALAPLAAARGLAVRVVPHALAAAPPQPSGLRRAELGIADEAHLTLVSFSLASSFERKNPLAAIAAHARAFGARADRILLLKVGKTAHHGQDLARLRAAIAGLPNIRLETRLFAPGDSHALTAMADVVLSLHRSEGFGLVPAEAMMLGRPVVATDWSGTTDFLDAGCGIPVPFRLVPARDPRGVFEAPGAVWAEADEAAAAAALRALADDPARRAALGAAAAARARAAFGTAPLEAALASLAGGPRSGDRKGGGA